jgi:diguanylate cyclase (GGDEF)-like protein/PAS domain S-box-containing protein
VSTYEAHPADRVFERGPQYDRLLTSISHHFLRIEARELQDGIVSALRSICEATGADRAVLYEVDREGRAVTAAHPFATSDTEWNAEQSKKLSTQQLSWLCERLARRDMIHIPTVAELPEEARTERHCLEDQGLHSVVCIPMFSENRLHAVACFATEGRAAEWKIEHLGFFRGAAGILGSATRRLRTELELAASREWLELAVRAGHSVAWEWHPDTDEIIFSGSSAEIFGIDADEIPQHGAGLLKFVPKEDLERIREIFREVFKTGEPFIIEHRIQHPERGTLWAMVQGQVIFGASARVSRVIGVSADINELKRAEHALQREKEHAQVTLASISDGVIRTDSNGRIEYLNPAAEKLIGHKQPQIEGQHLSRFYQVLNVETGEIRANVVEECLASKHVVEPTGASTFARLDGSEVSVRESAAPIFGDDGQLVGAVLVITEVTQLRALQQRMAHLATHDPLTGLINRREFEQRLEKAIGISTSSHRQFALCYLDLDEFKVVNDTCGHAVGDQLLQQLTSVLNAVIREGDTLARLGGDEFGVLLADCDLEEAENQARKVIDAVRQYRFQWEDRFFEIAASIGIVPISSGQGNLAELLSAADSACYVAKDRGRNQIHVSRIDDTAVTVRHTEMRWIEHINRALDEGRFRLFRQPIRPLQEPSGPEFHELLLRLVDIHGAIVAPNQFIGAAERYRMMPVIDLWVVGAALDTIGSLNSSSQNLSATFTINLSGQSFGNSELKKMILDGLERLQIPPRQVMFEITETAAISNLSVALEFISALRACGCRFVLDDFGSGLSSFRYLKSLDVEFLKIDGGLVREIARDPIQREMVAAIHRIGESMGIQTIGEWVEDVEIESALRDIGVDYAQGFGVGRPEPFIG